MTATSNRKHDRASFYKYVTASTAKIILRDATLRWSSPLIFPDPFDVPRLFEPEFTESELQAVVVRTLADLIESGDFTKVRQDARVQTILRFPGFSTNASLRKQAADDLRAKHASGALPVTASFDDLKRMWDSHLHRARILCLTTKRDNSAMWQHYAGNNTGVLIELTCSDERDSPWLLAREVKYQDGKPAFLTVEQWAENMTLGDSSELVAEALLDMQYYKKIDWSYEREWRLAYATRVDDGSLYSDRGFDKRDLASITLGALCSHADREEILSLLVNDLSGARLYQAVFDSSQHGYEFFELPRNSRDQMVTTSSGIAERGS